MAISCRVKELHGLRVKNTVTWKVGHYVKVFLESLPSFPHKGTGLDNNEIFQHTIVNIFLPIILTYVLCAQKNRLNETVLLSTHNICFG